MFRGRTVAVAAAFGFAALSVPGVAGAQERQVKITGFGAKSGVVRLFGINTKAALEAAAEQINKAGGVKLGDGTKGKIVIEFLDDRCNAEEGISVLRRMAPAMRSSRSVRPAPTSPSRCSASCRRESAMRATPACSSRSSRTSPSRSSSPRSPSGRSATFRTKRRCSTLFKWLKATRPDLKSSTAASRRISPTRAPPGTRS